MTHDHERKNTATARRTWLITGVSSGFGRELTTQLLERGDRVVGTVRDAGTVADLLARHPGTFRAEILDVTDATAVRTVVDRSFAEQGRVDVVVSNAGYGLFGAAEELSDAQVDRMIATNLTGSIQLIRSALPHLRAQGGGRIVQISSYGGQVAFAGNSMYHATKWGIEGFQTSCVHGGWYGAGGVGGGQAEAVRVPQADGTLVAVPGEVGEALLPSLLTLSDVYLTGYHAAHRGKVSARTTVTVIGDGAVGLSAVLASRHMGAERIILMGRHQSRTDLGREFGATDVVAEGGAEGVAKVMELTGSQGSHVVLEAVGHMPAYEQAYGIVRPGGVISRVGVPQYESAPIGFGSLFGKNATLTGGPAPVRAYIEAALPDVLEGRIEPGKVFDRTVALSDVAEGYRLMDSREALKVLVTP